MVYELLQAKSLRLALGMTLLFSLIASAFGNISGAIYTSLGDGTTVNQNLYANAQDVYLNGGPQNVHGAGLPDGIYYFQVTVPNGSLLLSNDPASYRLLQVVGGVVDGVPNLPNMHAVGTQNPITGSIPVQLWPFDLTTNQGGEYKVWMIPFDAATIDQDGKHLIFDHSNCKTDNFKVGVATPPGNTFVTLAGHKFYDTNMDGVDVLNNVPEGEKGVTNFIIHITLTDSLGNPVTISPTPLAPVTNTAPGVYEMPTTTGGNWSLGNVPTGTFYSVCEVLPPYSTAEFYAPNASAPVGDGNWLQTAPGVPGDPIDPGCFSRGYDGIAGTDDIIDLNFGNIEQGRIGGTKFYDANKNGVKDAGELGVSGINIHIAIVEPDGSTASEDVTTASDGTWMSGYYPDGSTYTVTETGLGAQWLQTTGPITGTIGPGTPLPGQFDDYDATYTIADVTNLNVGNILLAKISGTKFYDKNMNGTFDNTELPISGFTITINVTGPDGTVYPTETLTTGTDGKYQSLLYPDGSTYTISETLPGTWKQTAPAGNLYSGTIGGAQGSYTGSSTIPDVTGKNFGNIQQAHLTGLKFYDQNGDGIQNNGDPGIQGFKIVITATLPNGSADGQTLYTIAGGSFTSKLFPDGTTYTVVEVAPDGSWHRTVPVSGSYTGTITGTVPVGHYDVSYTIDNVTGLIFGNYKLGAGGGLTLGFWSNKNGYAKANAAGWANVFAILNNSCLRNAAGTEVTWPVTANGYKSFQTWILNANATNMAYMLSAQLAAMELNVLSGGVSGSSLIYAPGTLSANAQGFATVNAIINEAIAELCLHGYTVASGPTRTYQTALKDALDKANNNLTFIQGPITIIVPSPY